MTVSNKIENEEVYGSLSLEIEDNAVKKPKESIFFYFSVTGACLMTLTVGANAGWTSPVLEELKSDDTNINPLREPLTTYQVAILTSLLPLGAAIGSWFLTKVCDVIGRKRTLMLLSVLQILLNAFISFSSHVYCYYIARFLIGICCGVIVPAVSIFLTEISENHNRGMIGCFMGLSFPLGNLFVYLLGSFLSVKIFTLICSLPNIVSFLCFLIFIPESPYYSAGKGQMEDTTNALERLRNKNLTEIEKELEMIVQTLKITSKEEKVTWKTMFTDRGLRKGFILALVLNIMPQLSGIGAILAFAGPLFNASGTSLKGDKVAIIIGLVSVASSLLPSMIIERIGRRPLLMISTLGGSIPLLLIGFYFYFENSKHPLLNSIFWLPLVSVLVYLVFFSVGLGVIPVAMMSELFPSNAKAKASSACCFANFILFFAITLLFPIINDFMGPSWCLWMFGAMEVLSALFVYFFVPEINGKSFLEVQELLLK